MIQLTEGQKAAQAAFVALLIDPEQSHLLIQGFAGTGKTFLVNELIRCLPKTLKMAKLITGNQELTDLVLTASTNKAAHALQEATGCPTKTIHKVLNLSVSMNPVTGETGLSENKPGSLKNSIVIIDEASFISNELLLIILRKTENCKVVFIGDPAQLASPGENTTPVFGAGFITVRMTEVVRQAKDNPIIGLATQFREVVEGGHWPKIELSDNICHVPRDTFNEAIEIEFTESWEPDCSKILANTNKRVQVYNQAVRENLQGHSNLQAGDWVVNNSYVSGSNTSISTDENVRISSLRTTTMFGIEGQSVMVQGSSDPFFMPFNHAHKKKAIASEKKAKRYQNLSIIYNTWIDLRSPYASTVHKAQGSTYEKVFIDLDDIGRTCRDPNQVARLLYVAVSRASEKVIMTGDLIK